MATGEYMYTASKDGQTRVPSLFCCTSSRVTKYVVSPKRCEFQNSIAKQIAEQGNIDPINWNGEKSVDAVSCKAVSWWAGPEFVQAMEILYNQRTELIVDYSCLVRSHHWSEIEDRFPV
jgi:hypothetical protein